MGIVEEILKRSSGLTQLKAGDIIEVKPDLVMSHDGDNIYNVNIFYDYLKCKKVIDREKIITGLDHNVPAESVETADVHNTLRRFAEQHNLTFYDHEGILHQIMIEKHVKPYQLIFAADSHACTYGAIGALGIPIGATDNAYIWATGNSWINVPEILTVKIDGKLPNSVSAKDVALYIIKRVKNKGFLNKVVELCGSTVYSMGLSEKITLCNMLAEASAISVIIDPDQPVINNPDMSFDISSLEPMVAAPHHVDNVFSISEVEGISVDQVFIGSCTNGRSEDFEIAARIVEGKKVAKGIRLFICPASKRQLDKIYSLGILKILLDAGAILLNPGCSLCFGACQGLMSEGETLFSTGNRNHRGRVGSNKSNIYLGSPEVAAATALSGTICDPRKLNI